MTTFTSNNNNTFGKTYSDKPSFTEKYDYSNRSGCGGYVLLAVLVVVAIVIFTFIAQHI